MMSKISFIGFRRGLGYREDGNRNDGKMASDSVQGQACSPSLRGYARHRPHRKIWFVV